MTNQELERRGYLVVWDGRVSRGEPTPSPSPVPDYSRLNVTERHRSGKRVAADCAAVLACLHQRPCRRIELKAVTGLSENALTVAISRLLREDVIVAAGWGVYRLASEFVDQEIAR